MKDGMTVQVVGHESGKEENGAWTRIDVANHKGKFPVKFKGAKAEHLTRDLISTLADGETIASKKLFVELFGEWTTFTRPGSTYKVRYFKAEDYAVIDGPSLTLARMRGQAAEVLANSEALRNAGAVGQAYKFLAAHLAEIAQIPLDLSQIADLDDALIGRISEEEFDPEAAAAEHFAREDAAARAQAAMEDAEIPVAAPAASEPAVDADMDDIPMSAADISDVSDLDEAAPLEIDQDMPAETDADPYMDDAENEEVPEEEPEVSEEDEQDMAMEDAQEPSPAPVRRTFGFGRR